MRRFLEWTENLAALFLLAIALLTACNVVLRYVFAIQIPDHFDISKFLQAIALFWGIAVTTYYGTHICVDLVWEHLGNAGRRRLDMLATSVTLALLAPVAWMTWVKVFTSGTQPRARPHECARPSIRRAGRRTPVSRDLVAFLGFVAMFVLMALRVPIGVAMGLVGVIGFGALTSWTAGVNLLANVPLSVLTDYNLSVIPMFILMGAFATHAGMSRELFRAGNAWLGHRTGGLALATIMACAGFAAINGSSVATAATMSQVALPEMRKAGYDPGVAAGVIAAGGTLGIMIPPSVIFVLYGVMTETDITRLFFAGVVPGLLAILLYAVVVRIIGGRYPGIMPRGALHDWAERFATLKDLWAVLALFLFVLGGMYVGFFTVTEAAGFGAVGTLVIGLLRRRLGVTEIRAALIDTLRVSSAIMMIVVGAFLFGYFLTITQFTQKAVDFLINLPIGAYGVLAIIMIGYFVLGAVMDELAMILLTVPIVFPAMMKLGFDPVWFGVIIVMAVTFGMICPPVGMNVFVINSIARDISLSRIYRGTMPFIAVDVVRLAILCAFPALSLWLPNLLAR
jgi:tripartite ATP-independent transporter DctM subunit